MKYLARLTAHLAWADRLVLESLGQAPDADRSCLELLAHVLGAEHVWLARLALKPAEVAVWPALTLEECIRLAERNRVELTAYVTRLTPEDLERPIAYTNSAGQQFTSTVEDILLHVCLHGAYHRGQIARGLRGGGQVPAPTDYIAFTRGSPAATRRPTP
jgi:uncharacterized damage-inducible protein DinB